MSEVETKLYNWLMRLSPIERKMPVYYIAGKWYSVEEAYFHVKNRTPIGMKIIEMEQKGIRQLGEDKRIEEAAKEILKRLPPTARIRALQYTKPVREEVIEALKKKLKKIEEKKG
jgi:ribosomal 50S subunit-associated protein YjgA (DUF615 family)